MTLWWKFPALRCRDIAGSSLAKSFYCMFGYTAVVFVLMIKAILTWLSVSECVLRKMLRES